jgi:hypothetical protein
VKTDRSVVMSASEVSESALTLSDAQRASFARDGVLKWEGALPPSAFGPARSAVFAALERAGVWSNGAWQFDRFPRQAGVRLANRILGRTNRSKAVAGLVTDALREAMHALVPGERLQSLIDVQLLVTMPDSDAWCVPAVNWHVDGPRLRDRGCPGVQMFTFVDPVEPQGGGTLVVAGSHRLLNGGRFIASRDIKNRLSKYPFFATLLDRRADRAGLLSRIEHIDDVELRVVELTGAPGDVYLTDLRVLHTIAPNVRATPRLMATQRFLRESGLEELEEIGMKFGAGRESKAKQSIDAAGDGRPSPV